TLLLKRRSVIGDLVTSGLDTVGLRCPNHSLTHELLQSLEFPLAAPSANPFGYVSPTSAMHVNDQLGNKIQYILDGGACDVGIESTIVGFPEGKPVIYRTGGLSIEKIEAIIGRVTLQVHSTSNPTAPGQLLSHYAPRKKIIVGELDDLIKGHSNNSFAVLSFQKDFDQKNKRVLSPSGNLEEAAKHFFTFLRELDKMPVDLILAEFVPDTGLGRAINDRLRRAAASR
ncbi:MAG TPA: L-threonylcarbamoyladenylate synthase, partial [Cyclobacteriaceae bacterium]|nr:L-threonylcarbamoyladenylate synthase [Cyclobacteriaceae bacterium]